MKFIFVIILTFGLFVSLFAQVNNSSAHPFSNSWVITAEGGVTIGGTDFPDIKPDYFGKGSFEYFLPTSSSHVFGLRLLGGGGYVSGKGLNSNQLLYSNIDEFNTKIVFGGAGLVYSLSLGSVVQPYLFAGVSYLIFDPLKTDGTKMPRYAVGDYANDDKDYMGEFGIRFLISNRMSFNVGYTLNYLINDNIDDIYNSEDDAFHNIFGGFSYYFFPSADSDRDGVKDSKDMCNNTPEGVSVDEFGCALDSDNDHVPDYLDLCLDTPERVDVDSTGCAVDSDGDGIADYLDNCPQSAANTIVDENGCEKVIVQAAKPVEEEKKVAQKDTLLLVLSGTANFESGKAELLPNPKSGLDRLSDFMKEHPKTKWVIEGHTDNIGSDKVNKKLSLDRAKSVLSYFKQKGIDGKRFQILGAGASKPVADNSIEFGRALNRRVLVEEEESFERRKNLMHTIQPDEYNLSAEYNIESLIFTDNNYFCIQVSSWKSESKAQKEVKRLVEKGHSAFIISSDPTINGEEWFRVRIGFFDNLNGAREYLKTVR